MKLRIIISTIAFLAFFSISLGAVLFFNSLRDKTYDEEASRAEELVHEIAHDIDLHIREYSGILAFISRQEEFKKALESDDAETLSSANSQLDRLCSIMEDMDVCYLMDVNGNAIASSNRSSTDSFVGKNYSFRPYFKQAVSGVPAVYAALGVTSKKRGLYYSYPVYSTKDERPSGVIVIKENIEHLRAVMVKPYEGVMMMTGPNGVVFFSNREGWLYKTLWEVTPEQALEIKESRQFGDGPWEWAGIKRTGEDHAVDTVGREYHIHQKELRNMPGWNIVYLHDHEKVIGGIGGEVLKRTGYFFLGITIFFGIFILYLLRTASIDLSLRKKAAEELKKSEEQFRMLFDSAVDGIFVLDMQGRFLDVNRTAHERLGYTKEEMLSLHITELDPPEFAVHVPKRLEQIRNQDYAIFESAHCRKDKSIMPVEVNSRVIDYKGQKVYFSVIRDITERKKTAEEQEHLSRELEIKNKELQQIVYTVSHDLRSPIINIRGYSRMLVDYLQKVVSAFRDESIAKEVKEKAASIVDKDIPEAVSYIDASINKMDSLLSAMLKLSRSASAELQIKELDMDRIVPDVLKTFNFEMKAVGAEVKVSPLPSCSCDEIQINQVFSNLISNAVKYHSFERPLVINISGTKDKGQVVYCVEDNGIGIPSDEQGRIFNIFYRGYTEGSIGEGIGLAIVQKIIERHSGKVWVESEVGKGSKFYVQLKCANA